MQALSEGTRLADRYTLVKSLGEGGMAELWLAHDDRAGATVTLKFLKSGLLDSAGQRELFHKEWQIASRLMHAHIARVFEYHDEARPFYAMQFIDGPTLGELAGERLANVLPPVGLLADALRYAHGKNIVHRDIKSDNVLIDQRGAPYLIDFGIAGAATGGSAINSSPQQKSGQRPQAADDIYALGVLLHEIVTGEPPPPEGPAHSLERPSGERVPDGISGLIEAMLAADPGKRPSADQVRQRLDSAGFAPGPAQLPSRLRSRDRGHSAADIEIQSVRRSTRPSAATPPPGGSAREHQGLSPRVVYGALAILLALLVGVTFLLPGAVEDNEGAGVRPETVADTEPPPTASSDEDRPLDDVVPESGLDGSDAGFSENLGQTSADAGVRAKILADEALGDLLSRLERLKYRGIERWGGQPYLDALDVYQEGDQAYVNKNYATAGDRYRQATDMLDPFFDRIEDEFRTAMAGAREAFENRNAIEAVRLFDLAVAITPGNEAAETGLARARSLADVLDLMRQGRQYLDDLELEAAKLAFEKALELDPLWEPAREALDAVAARITQQSFERRMTEGFSALASGDFETARAAFNAAKKIYPDSPEPVDGLLQVDQEIRLYRIRTMEREAAEQEANEEWESAVATYEALLEVDGDLAFAQAGLARSRQRAALHQRLQAYIDDPDSLSDPVNMQNATELMLSISRMPDVGPRLEDHKDVLARLLKRAATPLTVELVSDNQTEVSVYKVGKLGTFAKQELELRPGNYVAVGIRPGFRDVRREFRVAPEIDMEPVVVRCEEPI